MLSTTTSSSSTTTTSLALQSSKSVARDDRRTCADPPVISNGRWLCNSNSYSNGVVCTNQCFDGFSFDRKDFFRQEISCKCIIDNDGRNQCRWTQRSRVIKEATELLPDFWQNSKLPECLPNDISQKSKYIIQNFRNFFLREITNWIQITTKAVKILNRLKMEI